MTVCQPKSPDLLASDRLPPQIVDPDKTNWFNAMTGAPQLWYWTGPGETYVFFDKAGFDPNTGDPLKRVDRQFQREWAALMANRRKQTLDLADHQQKEVALRQERAGQDAKRIQGCDAVAANSNDSRKPASIPGVGWDVLKANAVAAIQDCEAAVRLQPGGTRYRYQLARAYSVEDPKRALSMFKKLCDERYPAAYDNYGWMLLDRRIGRGDNITGATRAFESGVDAGDSDAMTSIATLMTRGNVEPHSPDEALQLYRRAARLGNANAAAAVAQLEADQAQLEAMRLKQAEEARQEAIRQQQAAQAFMGAMGGVLRNVGRR